RRKCRRDGQEGLHVGSSAPVEAAVPFGDDKRITAPVLPLDRNYVTVSRKHDATFHIGSQGGEQIGLGTFSIHGAPTARSVSGQIAFHPRDKLQIGMLGDCWKGDETLDHFPRSELFFFRHLYP